jgi:predicted TIM-barrel fold metal-dependent hydrolase
MKRRELLHTAFLAGAAAALAGEVAADDDSFAGIIDSNVNLFHWPFRRLPLDEPGQLVAKLRSLGVTTAFAGTFEGLLHRDLSGANARLAEGCSAFPELVAIGSINPALPGWEDDLHRCATVHGMPGIRLHPNYHGYTLDEACFPRLIDEAAKAGLFVQLAVAMEDTRTQSTLAAVPDVDLAALPAILDRAKTARLQLLNYKPRGPLLPTLIALPNLLFDTALADGTDAVASLMTAAGPGRVLFGSHAPFLIPEAALIRVHESGLDHARLLPLLRNNAENLAAKR